MDRTSFQKIVRAVDWKQLHGAYGAGFPVEEHLLATASADERAAYQALGKVLAHVCHQNVLAPAAPEAAACLLRIPELEEPAHAWVGLFGVVYLFASAWSTPRGFGLPPRLESFAGERPPQTPHERARQEAYDALSARLLEVLDAASDRLRALLTHPDPRTRAQSARLLALTDRDDEGVRRALAAAHDREADDAVRAGLLLALARRLSRTGSAGTEVLGRLHAAARSDGSLEPIGAAAALLLLDPGACLAQHAGVLQAGLRFQTDEAPYLFLRTFPWANGRVPDLMAEALAGAAVPDEQALEPLLEAVADWSSRTDEPEFEVEWSEQDLIAMRLLRRAFGGHLGRRDYLQASDLSPLQRSIAARLAPLPIEGEIYGPYGFRDLARDADRLLGRAQGGLDQELDGVWEDRPVRWPLWKWWHQASLVDGWDGRAEVTVARDLLVARVGRELAPSAIFRAAEDAVSGAYDVPHAPLVRLVAAVAEQVGPALERYVATVGPEPSGPGAALAVLPSLALAAAGGSVPWLERVRPWLDRITPAELAAEAIALARRT